LHIVWLGANDVRDALEALATDPTSATSVDIIQAAITAIGNNIFTLWGAGARTFLVPNVPNLAITPAVAAQPAQVRAVAAQLSGAYNAALSQLLNNLSGQLPGTTIVRLDVFALLNGIVATPSAYGIKNTVEPCLRFGVIAQPFCAHPRQYLFWDAIHPTAAVHGILAERAAAAFSP
jgi:phospholipase/lecithinase/hemolysin